MTHRTAAIAFCDFAFDEATGAIAAVKSGERRRAYMDEGVMVRLVAKAQELYRFPQTMRFETRDVPDEVRASMAKIKGNDVGEMFISAYSMSTQVVMEKAPRAVISDFEDNAELARDFIVLGGAGYLSGIARAFGLEPIDPTVH